MRASLLAVALLVALTAVPARACGDALEGARRIESERYVLAYRTVPRDIPLGRHFSVEMEVCAKPGAPVPESVRIEAVMPEHGHGMNYRPKAESAGKGRYRFTGLMLHMPGTWRLTFDLFQGARRTRLTEDVRVER